ncbi:hypothetical protein N7444_002878 [Penicillium canescens]|nr:hypothetical protein N7444_002878 [Penicillium canescens]
MSRRDLREYLSNLLRCIEQISAQSLNAIGAICTLSKSKLHMPLSEKAKLVMVCFSVGVIATPGDGTPWNSYWPIPIRL